MTAVHNYHHVNTRCNLLYKLGIQPVVGDMSRFLIIAWNKDFIIAIVFVTYRSYHTHTSAVRFGPNASHLANHSQICSRTTPVRQSTSVA
jgi:hypothetical protein